MFMTNIIYLTVVKEQNEKSRTAGLTDEPCSFCIFTYRNSRRPC